ncbi:tyrosine-type recombinase/integrase [Nitratireductor sp. GCM10026969]|uniref:tyrosine-type recombinase/integrase n=1 Tax=Nitratireductor sp. GCM10026969 TaxID=3252645 RepID=UPI0036243C15
MLTDTQVKSAKKAGKPYKMTDGAGLHLFVSAAGGKLWRFRYEFGGKEKVLSIGAYPGVSLADARKARDEAKEALKTGRDPSVQKKLAKHAAKTETFEEIAQEWYRLHKDTWVPRHADDVITSLGNDVFPYSGKYGHPRYQRL